MLRIAFIMSMIWCCSLANADTGDQGSGITMADQPLRLIRAATMYQAGAGLAVQPEDILETGKGSLQLELTAGLLLMGPNSRLYVNEISSTRGSVVALTGWIKIVSLHQGQRISVMTPSMQVVADNGAAIIHAASSQTELFVESGSHQVKAVDLHGATGSAVAVKADQFTIANQVGGVQVGTRASREFIAQMPLAFRDQVLPVNKKMTRSSPSRMHEIEFSDIEPWLKTDLVSRKVLTKQVVVRLKDPEFHRQFDAEMGQIAEWKALLRSTASVAEVQPVKLVGTKPIAPPKPEGFSTTASIASPSISPLPVTSASIVAPVSAPLSTPVQAAAPSAISSTAPSAASTVAVPVPAIVPVPVNPITLLNAVLGPPPPEVLKALTGLQGQPIALDRLQSALNPESNRSKIIRIKQHEAQASEIELWLKDAEFRRLFDAELGQSPEWKSLLHPAVPSQ